MTPTLEDARLHDAPVYVHCKAGKSRSVTCVIAYLIRANAWTMKASYDFVQERREGISPNLGFIAELMAFEKKELGLSGPPLESGAGDDEADSREGSERRMNRGARESLPPQWLGNGDWGVNTYPFGMPDDPPDDGGSTTGEPASNVATPRAAGRPTGSSPVDVKSKSKAPEVSESGTEKEVRRDGQYVHFRR